MNIVDIEEFLHLNELIGISTSIQGDTDASHRFPH